MNKVEILAPAGDMDCFKAAIAAGADAVYMSGKAFGARANATNFTTEEYVWALDYAHIHGRKIYLTLNTLIKESEWKDIYEYVLPLYEAGLDGVIIQDLGLFDYFKVNFPNLPLHASTQLTITEAGSANLLKEHGVCRVVPARELSLNEIKTLKEKSGLEIETFVHGALCYCYSGQCLFSSFLGGRSGNRGRCAGPCRLPYSVFENEKRISNNEEYPLSLKDLCTIEHIGQLIEAGIDSFKIEGRMKSPEYVAGVTSIYRKYTDLYYQGKSVKVSTDDMNILKSLYLRSSTGSGYYFNYNGKEMVSLDDPSYNSMNKDIADAVHDKYCNNVCIHEPLSASVSIHSGQEMLMTVYDNNGNVYSVTGANVEKASNRAATKEDILLKLNKTGQSNFSFENIEIDMDDDCFVPVSHINELRRNALSGFEEEILKNYHRHAPDRKEAEASANEDGTSNCIEYDVSIMKEETLKILKDYSIRRVYIPFDLIYLNKSFTKEIISFAEDNKEVYIMLPRIFRDSDNVYYNNLKDFLLKSSYVSGIVVRNLEQVYWLNNIGIYKENYNIILDHTIYGFNKKSMSLISEYADYLTAPLELSFKDINKLNNKNLIVCVYGYTSLMVSANCLAKTMNKCSKNRNAFDFSLLDRVKKTEASFQNCVHCYNEIFNSVPVSLHNKLKDITLGGYRHLRIDFTFEDSNRVKKVLDYYLNNEGDLNDTSFTTGHFEKGAI